MNRESKFKPCIHINMYSSNLTRGFYFDFHMYLIFLTMQILDLNNMNVLILS